MPRSISVRTSTPSLSAAEVDACLLVAREISELTDRAAVAKARDDIPTFNTTVAPYNDARLRWNAGCLKPYSPGDMIRAENRRGVRLCTLTRSPCLSETERAAVLARERARQSYARSGATPAARLTRGTGFAPRPVGQVRAAAQSSPALATGAPATGDDDEEELSETPTRPAAPPASDIDADLAWTITEQADAVAAAKARARYPGTLEGAKLDEAANVQEEIFRDEVMQRVMRATPDAERTTEASVIMRVLGSWEAGSREAMETVCVSGGADADSVARCNRATRDGFLHAYRRRQELQVR